MRTRRPAIILTAFALTIGLTGCFGTPIENLVEGVIEDQTGVDVETGTDGESATVPGDWPGQPIPAGRIVSSVAAEGTFSLTIAVDSEDEIQELIAELLADGYEETARADLGGIETVVVASPEWTVSLMWYSDEESDGVVLNYGVAVTGG